MENWLLINDGQGDPAWNMACDEWLLLNAARLNNPVLRIYEWDRAAITIGYFQEYPLELDQKYVIVRRPTGGALVYHDSDLTFTVSLPPTHPWKALKPEERYQKIHERVHKIFESRGLSPALAEKCKTDNGPCTSRLPNPTGRNPSNAQCFTKSTRYDVMVGNSKVAGGAQRTTRDGLLHQGSIQSNPRVSSQELKKAWESFGTAFSDFQLSDSDRQIIEKLAQDKYATKEWNHKS
jgi:lipoyl(octanoyl) transferase